ncbi:PREDICTED: uncharacterized protein LOC101625404 [Condylura cristata]|uniref:uncharacterized protein LOC101625404 n=1 Tax=Condylura cristata TaxID=143302 RepID=UPI0003345EBB|nr:PREDICTED: uncharacterized protein LOC101625404 [Condylura cristata]
MTAGFCDDDPKPGDLIEIFHHGYEHWALFEGSGYVIHLAPQGDGRVIGPSTIFSVLGKGAMVKRERLKDIVGVCDYQVNNHLDQKYRPLPVNQILKAAKGKIGEAMPYHVRGRKSEQFVADLRYGVARTKQLLKEPKPGDLIEIFRPGYQHWGLYVGDDHIVHLGLANVDSNAGFFILASSVDTRAVVKRELLAKVVGDSKYEINNYLDNVCRPRLLKKILQSAEEVINQTMEYNSKEWNCEHFVTYLRYGVAHSAQGPPPAISWPQSLPLEPESRDPGTNPFPANPPT